MDDPHLYSYSYVNEGGTMFTIRASGDLDCDGTYSSYEMVGRVEDGAIVGAGGILKMNELE
jgi:hypothetical protein